LSIIFKIVITGPGLKTRIEDLKAYANSESYLNIIATEVLYKRTKEDQILIWLLKESSSAIKAYYRNALVVVYLGEKSSKNKDHLKNIIFPAVNDNDVPFLYIINGEDIKNDKELFDGLNDNTKVTFMNNAEFCFVDTIISEVKSEYTNSLNRENVAIIK